VRTSLSTPATLSLSDSAMLTGPKPTIAAHACASGATWFGCARAGAPTQRVSVPTGRQISISCPNRRSAFRRRWETSRRPLHTQAQASTEGERLSRPSSPRRRDHATKLTDASTAALQKPLDGSAVNPVRQPLTRNTSSVMKLTFAPNHVREWQAIRRHDMAARERTWRRVWVTSCAYVSVSNGEAPSAYRSPCNGVGQVGHRGVLALGSSTASLR